MIRGNGNEFLESVGPVLRDAWWFIRLVNFCSKKKTKGAVSSLLFACVLFLIGFWSGLLPEVITTQSWSGGAGGWWRIFGTAFHDYQYRYAGD